MKDTNIKWDTIFYGRQWVSNIIETIQKKMYFRAFI